MIKNYSRVGPINALRPSNQRNVSHLMKLDYATLPRKELGRVLALNLSQSVNPGATELQEAQNANVNSNLYFNELYFLCGFAVCYALSISPMQAAYKDDVMKGYLEVFEEQALESSTQAAYVRVFRSRIAAYHEVAKDMQPTELTPIAVKFGSFLSDSTEGKARFLAHKYAPFYFSSHVEHTVNALRSAGLFS